MLKFMGKKQKKVKENQTIKQKKVNNGEAETQVVKAKQERVNYRHKNGLYSDAELTEEDKQSELYKGYLKVKGIPYCKQFLRKQWNLPQWGKIELEKVTSITKERDRRCYNDHRKVKIQRTKNYNSAHKKERRDYQTNYKNNHKQEIKNYQKIYNNNHKQERKDYLKIHKENYSQYKKNHYKRIIENIKKVKAGQIDELNDKQLLTMQNLMKRVHTRVLKKESQHNIHGLYLGDKNNNDIYDRNNLQGFKDFLKSQVGFDAVSQIDFNELDNMRFDFNEFSNEEDKIFNNSYFNNDIIPNENHQQDNNDQPINTQKEQTLNKYGYQTYGHKINGTNDEELFALNHAHEFDEQSI